MIIKTIKQFWVIAGNYIKVATLIGTIIGVTVKGTIIWVNDHQELSNIKVIGKSFKELTDSVNSIHRELKTINYKVDNYGKQTEKTVIVVTDIAGKVLTRDEFNQYYKPTLNFNYDFEKKKETHFLNICTLLLDTSAYTYIPN